MPEYPRSDSMSSDRRATASVAAVLLATACSLSPAVVSAAGPAGAVAVAQAPSQAQAQAQAEAQGALAQLREFAQATQSARGEFSQRTLRSAGQPPEQASGAFAFARPGRFRWEVRKPYEQLMVADGEQLHFFDKDLNQVTVRRLSDSLGASPAAILFGSNELERSFVLKEAGTREGLDWLDAQPRSKDAGFERILIGFRAGLPEAMEVRDAFGRTTVFAFRGVERNPRIDPEQFRFVAPRGADVIRQ
jgi:outer membrane lipoprotein carrier protein